MKHGLSLALALMVSTPALAQGNYAWYLTSITDKATSTMDIGRLERRGDVAVAMSTLYFVRTQRGSDGEEVDFIKSLEAYDGSAPGRQRILHMEGHRVDVGPPVFVVNTEGEAPVWKTYQEGSPGMASWTAACKGPNPKHHLKNVQTHEQVLEGVRKAANTLDR